MTFSSLPQSAIEALEWPWKKYAPFYQDLAERQLDAETLESWMADWTQIEMLLREVQSRLYVGTTLDTGDQAAEKRFYNFLEDVYPNSQAAGRTGLNNSPLS